MEQIENQIGRIQIKLQDLLKKQASLQKQNQQQLELINTLKKQQEDNQSKIKALEEQQYILKSAAGQLDSTDKKEFEKTISRYIKEIDKCIALLSE